MITKANGSIKNPKIAPHFSEEAYKAMNRGKHSKVRRRPVWPAFVLAAVVIAAAAVLAVPQLTADKAPEEAGPVSGQETPDAGAEPEPIPEPEPELAPEPDPEPEPDPAETLLARMDLRDKICQMFIVFPSDLTGKFQMTSAGEGLEQALAEYPVGGILYDRSNMVSREQVRAMLDATQGYVEIPLILTCDEEGGRVNRLMDTVGTTWVGPMLDYKDAGVETARENARTIASDMVSCGFNMDLAPVADVWSNPANTVIGDRAYSDGFDQAAELVAAAVEGFHDGGAACTLKHFPGHGDTSADSHYGSVYVHKTLDELRQNELAPFRAGIAAGADAVMMGHLIIDQVDELPALLSYKVVTELLRDELDFGGVVITDSLQMQAMTDHYGGGEIAVGAVRAGVDVLLCPQNLRESVEALMGAVEAGEITEARINESVLRILHLKQNAGILAGAE